MTPDSFRARATAALRSMSAAGRRGLIEQIRRVAVRRKITYEYDKSAGEEPIRILFPPIFFETANVPALSEACSIVSRACERGLELFLERPEVRPIFPFEEYEERFIFSVGPERHGRHPAVWQRLDAALDPADPLESLRLMETNMNSVGGVHYGPAVEKLAAEIVLPALLDRNDLDRVRLNDDLEHLLFDLFSRHARSHGVTAGEMLRIAVVENDPDAAGCTESPAVVEGLCALGADAFLARPEEFEIRGDTLTHLGRPVDLIYRLFELREMKELSPMEPLRLAFAANRVVSNLAGEFDHKSMFELFTSAAFDRFFPSRERRLFRRHVLWTRLMRETFTDAPDGSKVDLPEFVFHSRDALVLKPNRSCGGEGIVIGRETDDRAWQSAVESAVAARGLWVVQLFHPLPDVSYCVIDPSGEVMEERLKTVYGFSATPAGFGMIGRASRSSIVNVARHGGLVPVLRLL